MWIQISDGRINFKRRRVEKARFQDFVSNIVIGEKYRILDVKRKR